MNNFVIPRPKTENVASDKMEDVVLDNVKDDFIEADDDTQGSAKRIKLQKDYRRKSDGYVLISLINLRIHSIFC